MTTFVLVHGAWHGGWCWRRVRQRLESGGAEVHTPTLTGLGERAHLLTPAVSLETHVCDVLGVLESEDLSAVVLVGHSYAGLVVSAVADRAPQRVARVVYLDAVVPRDGQCLFDRAPPALRERIEAQARAGGESWRIPVSAASPQFLGLVDDADVRWVMSRITPHPLRTFREGVRLGPRFAQVPRSYVNCIGERPFGQPRSANAEGIDDYHELRTGHDAMVTAPAEVAALLLRLGAN